MQKHADDNPYRQLGFFLTIVSELVGLSGAGIGLGYWLHVKWNAPLIIALPLSLLGLVIAFFRIYQRFNTKSNEVKK